MTYSDLEKRCPECRHVFRAEELRFDTGGRRILCRPCAERWLAWYLHYTGVVGERAAAVTAEMFGGLEA